MTPGSFHLAQINVGRLLAEVGSPVIADFIDNLDKINAVAEASPGFVWRLTGDGNDATDIRPFEDPMMAVNMSVWTDVASLGAFVYRSEHLSFMRRRREWFEEPKQPFMTLWWVPAGHRPTIDEGVARLEHFRANGPTPHAFSFKQPFAPAIDAGPVPPVLDECA
jgi:hypothetical protein